MPKEDLMKVGVLRTFLARSELPDGFEIWLLTKMGRK